VGVFLKMRGPTEYLPIAVFREYYFCGRHMLDKNVQRIKNISITIVKPLNDSFRVGVRFVARGGNPPS
jgi:hypothetical protein